MQRAPLVLSSGDPAGVGAEIAVRSLLELGNSQPCVIVGDAKTLQEHWAACGAEQGRLKRIDVNALPDEPLPAFSLVDIGPVSTECVAARAPTAEGGAWQLRALEIAAEIVAKGYGRALVTGPVSKEAISLSGTPFLGQTEFLARRAGLRADDVTMLFLGPRLRVSLVTTHFALRDVAAEITSERVMRSTRHLAEALTVLRPDGQPLKICVAGLNPHAGEGGLLGTEENEVVTPAITRLRDHFAAAGGLMEVLGPTPAEAAFRWAADEKVDGVVAMFHDQATIASKILDWGAAVNVTWGLPTVRTSVDHGVAYDAAASGQVSAEGMLAAVRMAARLSPQRASDGDEGESLG